MSKHFLTTYTASNGYDPEGNAKEIARFINDQEIFRDYILTIVAGPNYQTLYYYVEAVDVTIKPTAEHEQGNSDQQP